jgi:hypothetical protein
VIVAILYNGVACALWLFASMVTGQDWMLVISVIHLILTLFSVVLDIKD